jgi:hypothetical protein
MNRRAGQFGAGIWFILLVVYFFFFVVIVNSVGVLDDIAGDYSGAATNVDFTSLTGRTYCSDPRYAYDAATGQETVYSSSSRDRLFCEESIGVRDQTTCDSIAGCSWETVTTGFWFWTTVINATCIGDINATAYGVDMTDPIIGRPRVMSHDSTGVFSSYTPFSSPSPCDHENVIFNKTRCEVFTCSWTSEAPQETIKSATGIYDTVKTLFLFRYDFGFENAGLAVLANFIFIVLPLLMLIMALYFMLPIIH